MYVLLLVIGCGSLLSFSVSLSFPVRVIVSVVFVVVLFGPMGTLHVGGPLVGARSTTDWHDRAFRHVYGNGPG